MRPWTPEARLSSQTLGSPLINKTPPFFQNDRTYQAAT